LNNSGSLPATSLKASAFILENQPKTVKAHISAYVRYPKSQSLFAKKSETYLTFGLMSCNFFSFSAPLS